MKKMLLQLIKNVWLPLLLCAVFFFRIYQLTNSIQFDSDFGRDSLFAMRILQGKPTLLGAQASVGGFFLGPLYFYGIAAVFALVGYLPQAIMVLFALMNLAAAILIYRLLSAHVSRLSGVIGVALFAVQPMLVAASRGATHQPMLPFITVLVILSLLQAFRKKHILWHVLSGLLFGLFFHVHFSSFLLVPGYFLALFIWTEGSWKQKLVGMFASCLGMALMVSPLVLFDLKHGFITSKAFFAYLTASATGKEITQSFPHWSLVEKTHRILLFLAPSFLLQISALIAGIVGFILSAQQRKKRSIFIPMISTLFFSTCLFIFLYKGYLFQYYLIIPCTLGVVWLAAVIGSLRQSWISIVFTATICAVSIGKLTQNYAPTFRTIERLSYVSHAIEHDIAMTHPKSFAIFKDSSDGLTGLAYEYRFLLQRDGYVAVNEQHYNEAEVLYVIREEGLNDPLTLGNYEVAQFHPKKSVKIEELPRIVDREVTIFKLLH